MTSTPLSFVFDPGRRMRQLARAGALLCTVTTLLPLSGSCLWQGIPFLYERAAGHVASGYSLPFYGFCTEAFCWAIVPIFLCGPVFLYICSPRTVHSQDLPGRVAVLLLSAGSVISTYFAAVQNLPRWIDLRSDTSIAAAVSLSSVLLFICGVFVIRRKEHDSQSFIFSAGIFPIAILALAWSALVAGYGQYYLHNKPPGPAETVFFAAGLFGSLMLLVGWLGWWRAVQRVHKVNSKSLLTVSIASQ